MTSYRIGYGEDAHRLAPGLPLLLGNITIDDSPHGAVAVSDGDVVLHALADALLSAAALGDIGDHFPPAEPQSVGLSSETIVARALELVRARYPGACVVNAALVVTLDLPKLGPKRQAIQARVAEILGLEPGGVGLGFKTSEGLAPQHVQARATILLDWP